MTCSLQELAADTAESARTWYEHLYSWSCARDMALTQQDESARLFKIDRLRRGVEKLTLDEVLILPEWWKINHSSWDPDRCYPVREIRQTEQFKSLEDGWKIVL